MNDSKNKMMALDVETALNGELFAVASLSSEGEIVVISGSESIDHSQRLKEMLDLLELEVLQRRTMVVDGHSLAKIKDFVIYDELVDFPLQPRRKKAQWKEEISHNRGRK